MFLPGMSGTCYDADSRLFIRSVPARDVFNFSVAIHYICVPESAFGLMRKQIFL